MNGNKFVEVIIILAVLLLVGLGAGYFVVKNKNQVTPPSTSHQTLQSTSENYREADDFYSQRLYGQAIEKYNAALSEVDSLSQEVVIRLKIARATRDAGDNLKAVELFKDIIDNSRYANDLEEIRRGKTVAVAGLVAIFYQTHDRAVTEKIFSVKAQ